MKKIPTMLHASTHIYVLEIKGRVVIQGLQSYFESEGGGEGGENSFFSNSTRSLL